VVKGKEAFGFIIVGKSDFIYLIHFISGLQVLYREKERVIKPTYAKGGSWLPIIGFTNSLCARFTRMTTGHAPIGEYRQRFFPHLPSSCPCGNAEVQTREHIVMECERHNPSTRPCNIIINSFVHFLADNPEAFSFDNG